MPLETAATINQLNAAYPTSTDPEGQGDDHLRLIKSTLQTTFPAIVGVVNPSDTDLNTITGLATYAPLGLSVKDGDSVVVALASSNVTLTANQVARRGIKFTGTLTADVFVDFPVSPKSWWMVWNATTGAHTVTLRVTGTGGTSLLVKQGDIVIILSDAVNILLAAAPSSVTVPSGVIAMWAGSSASIPTGWVKCDGNNGTPNMQDLIPAGIISGTPGAAPGVIATTSGQPVGLYDLYFIMKL